MMWYGYVLRILAGGLGFISYNRFSLSMKRPNAKCYCCEKLFQCMTFPKLECQSLWLAPCPAGKQSLSHHLPLSLASPFRMMLAHTTLIRLLHQGLVLAVFTPQICKRCFAFPRGWPWTRRWLEVTSVCPCPKQSGHPQKHVGEVPALGVGGVHRMVCRC